MALSIIWHGGKEREGDEQTAQPGAPFHSGTVVFQEAKACAFVRAFQSVETRPESQDHVSPTEPSG